MNVPKNRLDNEKETTIKYSNVNEGKANIIQPESVFYNPVQEFNRDLRQVFNKNFSFYWIKYR